MKTWPSLTAEAVCLARALEAKHPRPLLEDPYARAFLRRPSRPLVRSAAARLLALPGLVTAISARHAWIDQHLRVALPNVAQVLILGAGYDSRNWRLDLPRGPVVEVDHPATQSRKRRRVADLNLPDPPHFVAADLALQSLDAVLDASPLQPGAPTAVVWEGVTMYLQRSDVVDTLGALSRFVGSGSHLFFDLWRPVTDTWTHAAMERSGRLGLSVLGEPLRFACAPSQVSALLHAGGWSAHTVSDVGSHARSHGRRAYPDLLLVDATPISP